MPGIGIGVGIGMKRVGKPYPTAGLQVIVYNQTYEEEGTTYLRTSTGVGIPKVSGTGNDTIWDFSVLSDTRFDKGSYVGNPYGLPENYDFPFVNIYFDETSEATRYHWKLKDFHYANLLSQSLLLDNQMFLRAKATTETSKEISEVYQLNIYESEQIGSALNKLKSWMRIAPVFYGENLIINGDFSVDSNSDGLADNWEVTISGSGTTNYIMENNTQRVTLISNLGVDYFKIEQLNVGIIGEKYHISCFYKTNNILSIRLLLNYLNKIDVPASSDFVFFEKDIMASQIYASLFIYVPNVNDFIEIKNVSIKKIYENYYKP